MKKQTLLVIGTISLILAGICFYSATKYLDDLAQERLYAPVVKVADGKELSPFQPITRDDVVVIQEKKDAMLPGSIASLDEVLGKRSIQTIFSGEQVLAQKLTDGYLLPETGQARYEFPLSLMMPVTEVRRGDDVKVWVKYKNSHELATLPAPAHFTKSNDAADLLFESQLATVKDSSGIEIYTLKPSILPQADQVENPFFHASKAQNLTDTERRVRDYRAQPSALPAFVGFNLTDQQFLILTEAINYGTIQIGHYFSR